MTSVLFSVFLLLQTAASAAGVKVSGKVTREQSQVSQTQVRLSSGATCAVQYAERAAEKILQGSYTTYTRGPGASAFARVTVAGTAVTGVELAVPRELDGRLSVEGDAPLPSSFTLPLMPGMSLTIRPQIDGSFRVQLPPGEYRLGAPLGLPPGYTLESIVYGGIDVLRNPLKVGSDDSTVILVRLALEGASPAVSVSGRVTGMAPGQVRRINLREPTGGDLSTALETAIGSDGAFTFPKVLPGNYIVYLNLRAQTQVTVGNKDVTNVTVAWPRDILVAGHVIVEGVQTVTPLIIVEGKGPAGLSQTRSPAAFILSLGKGENAISVRNIPEAYRLKSITYGDLDLQKEPLKLDGPAYWDIIVKLVPKE
jgi:hypothetical protein